MNDLITGLGTDLARWAAQMDTTAAHTHFGKGLQHRPSDDSTFTPPAPVAFWEKPNVRINVVYHTGHKGVINDLYHMSTEVHRHGSDDFLPDVFPALLQQWLQDPSQDLGPLKQVVMEQEDCAQKQVLHSTGLEFQQWLQQAHQKGLRGLFRTLRQRDQAWQRPFQDLPALERIQAREEQWGTSGFRFNPQCAYKSIDPSALQKLLRKLPNKAAGPDGISYDMVRHLPYPAVERLASLLTEMEKTALLPTRLRYTNIALVPKSFKIERPLALTSCLYRAWNAYRKHDIQHCSPSTTTFHGIKLDLEGAA